MFLPRVADDTSFGSGIRRRELKREDPGHRGHVDDNSAFGQVFQGQLGPVHDSDQVNPDHVWNIIKVAWINFFDQ